MSSSAPSEGTASFNNKLKDVLSDLSRHPYPYVPNPPNLKKRASVALIIRINPSYDHWPENDSGSNAGKSGGTRLTSFFAQDWVSHGTPEILFIKRANRKGDRWTGHVAMPGGGRDPEDEDDLATAKRETWEEVGIDLTQSDRVIHVGNVPQRLVTSSWGSVPLMVLCPYIFLITDPNLPPLRLQPTEIASAHWVPLSTLLSPTARTYEYQDVSSRLAQQDFGPRRLWYRLSLGLMLFSAVRLTPSASLLSEPPSIPEASTATLLSRTTALLNRTTTYLGLLKTPTPKPDLLLWGLTLGVVADFLELLPPHNALQLWTYPTFSAPDVRIAVWLLSRRFRREKYRRVRDMPASAPASVEVGLDAVPLPRGRGRSYSSSSESASEVRWHEMHPPGAGESGLGVAREHEGLERRRARRGSRSSRIGVMLEGYYEIIRRGIALAVVGRGVVALGVVVWLWRRWRRRG